MNPRALVILGSLLALCGCRSPSKEPSVRDLSRSAVDEVANTLARQSGKLEKAGTQIKGRWTEAGQHLGGIQGEYEFKNSGLYTRVLTGKFNKRFDKEDDRVGRVVTTGQYTLRLDVADVVLQLKPSHVDEDANVRSEPKNAWKPKEYAVTWKDANTVHLTEVGVRPGSAWPIILSRKQ